MNRRDIVIGSIILLVVVGVLFWRQRMTSNQNPVVPETLSVEDDIETRFNLQIPEDVEKAELTDPAGGPSSGIATRKVENGRFVFSVLADLPEPGEGQFYQGWLVRGSETDANFSQISAGKVGITKGGWMLNFESTQNLNDHAKVVITLEKVLDQKIETRVIEGSF